MSEHAPYEQARALSLRAAATTRVLGVPLKGRESVGYVPIWWCGIGSGGAEYRETTYRIWHLPEADIVASGVVHGYHFEGHHVYWYDLKRESSPVEESYTPVSLSHSVQLFLRRPIGIGWGGIGTAPLDPGDGNGNGGSPIPVTISPSPTASPTGAPPTTIQP